MLGWILGIVAIASEEDIAGSHPHHHGSSSSCCCCNSCSRTASGSGISKSSEVLVGVLVDFVLRIKV